MLQPLVRNHRSSLRYLKSNISTLRSQRRSNSSTSIPHKKLCNRLLNLPPSIYNGIKPLFPKILDTPFLQQLSLGTLPQSALLEYNRQDSLYLSAYKSAWNTLLNNIKLTNPPIYAQLLLIKSTSLAIEFSMKEQYFDNSSLNIQPDPITSTYIKFIYEASHAPTPIALAALSPCFIIYTLLAHHLIPFSSNENPYHNWLLTYSNTKQSSALASILYYIHDSSDTSIRSKMEEAAYHASSLELQFFRRFAS